MENYFFCLGAHLHETDRTTKYAVTKTHYLAYWLADSGGATLIKRNRGVQGKRAAGACIAG